MAEVALHLGALGGLTSDGASAYPVLTAERSASPTTEFVTASGGPVRLAPGQYFVEVRARPIDGALAPQLVAAIAGGGEHRSAMVEIESGLYRCTFKLARACEALSAEWRGSNAFIFVSGRILTADALSDAPPLFASAVVDLGRATFAKLPHAVRQWLLSPSRRASWLQRVRKKVVRSPAAEASGRLLAPTADADRDALRFDFENRLAVARQAAEPLPASPAPARFRAKAIAFYLPQFHPIPENDAWWGAGFTEWANVTRAIPQFVGHYQPRLPGELGFYDLRTPGVMAKQAELARTHGVSAFCFHYYWFDGKRLLEAPLNAFLEDASINIEFCLCWANENWTRRWDGDESAVLMAQHHSAENHVRIFADLARAMRDPRYVRVDGRPVLVVYRPDLIGDARAMTEIWRAEARKLGWSGLFLVATNAFGFFEAQAMGFDALAEFPPHAIQARAHGERLLWLNKQHAGKVFSYEDAARQECKRLRAKTPPSGAMVFPGVMPGWDNEARRPGAGVIYHGATPEIYGEWLAAAADYAERTLPPACRFVFINAWNEWAEGAYLEPDRAHGRAFLAATAKALTSG